MDQQVQIMMSFLQRWTGQQLLITKEENGDIDQTVINFNRLDLEDYENTRDDYLPASALQLVGNGQTIEETGDAPLPYGQFDIPLDEIQEVQCGDEEVFLKTARATYMISPV